MESLSGPELPLFARRTEEPELLGTELEGAAEETGTGKTELDACAGAAKEGTEDTELDDCAGPREEEDAELAEPGFISLLLLPNNLLTSSASRLLLFVLLLLL